AARVEEGARREGDGRHERRLARRSRPRRDPRRRRALTRCVRGSSDVTGPWTRAFLDATGVRHQEVSDTVASLRVESSLITATVDGRAVTLSAQPISPGVWAAIAAQVTPDR